jgi:hypothetical protein
MTQECVHHWIIDSEQKGICKYCKGERQFEKVLVEGDFLQPSWMKMRDIFTQIKETGCLKTE